MDTIDFIRNKVSECGSQSEIARKCGISQALVNKMIHDRYQVQINTIKKIARAYNLPLAHFIQEDSPAREAGGIVYRPDPPPLSADEQAILLMVKNNPELARKVRRFTEFEQVELNDTDLMRKKEAA